MLTKFIEGSARSAFGAVCLCAATIATAAPVIQNPSFEDNAPAGFPGYGPITGWSTTNVGRSGVNNSTGPFWDNGTNLNGAQVAFIQSTVNDTTSLFQSVAGFEAGKSYELRMRLNARNYQTLRPRALITIDGKVTSSTATVSHVSSTGPGNTGAPFILFTSQFPSPGNGSFELRITNAETRGDTALVVDGIELVEVPNVAPVATLAGSALQYNGTSTTAQIARPVQGAFTIEFWLRSSQLGGGEGKWYQGYSLVDGEVGGVVDDFGICLGAGKILFGTGNPDVTIKSGVVADGTWHHVAAVREVSSGLMQLYIDGSLVASATGGTQQLVAPTNLRVGGTNFDGAIDELRIWNQSRSSITIARDYRRQLVGNESGLVRYYRLDEATGTAMVDSSPSGVNTTLVGPTWTPGPLAMNRMVTAKDTDVAAKLAAFDANGTPLTTSITALPVQGTLYQYNAGVRGAAITTVPTAVSDAQARVIFAPAPGQTGEPYTTFAYRASDGTADSEPRVVTVDVPAAFTSVQSWQLFD